MKKPLVFNAVRALVRLIVASVTRNPCHMVCVPVVQAKR